MSLTPHVPAGDPTLLVRFLDKVDMPRESQCWMWVGAKTRAYGELWSRVAQRAIPAHRVAYELYIGPIPEHRELDHLCRNRGCVNPEHLEPVTRRENQLRGYSVSGTNARKTHCDHGHEFTDANTYMHRGGRHCRTCRASRKVA